LYLKPYIAVCDIAGGKHTDTFHEIELPSKILPYTYITEHGLLYDTHTSELKLRTEDNVWYREETMGYYYIDFATMETKELLKYSIWHVDTDPNIDMTRIRMIGLAQNGQIFAALEDIRHTRNTKIYVSNFDV